MSEKIGPIPKTAIITFETQKEIWQNVNWKIVKNFLATGIIEHEGVKKRIKIECQIILNPKNFHSTSKVRPIGPMQGPMMDGLSRITELFFNYNSNFRWVILGVLEGAKPTPILISYYKNLDLYIYTIELSKEEKDFMEINVSPN